METGDYTGKCRVRVGYWSSSAIKRTSTDDDEEDAVPAPGEFRPGQSKLSLKYDPEHSDGLHCLASCNNVPGVESQTFVLGRK